MTASFEGSIRAARLKGLAWAQKIARIAPGSKLGIAPRQQERHRKVKPNDHCPYPGSGTPAVQSSLGSRPIALKRLGIGADV
ncbi:hypothetical protein M8818_004259 [Zalaria obscura]|uniref:Uncharacterized protein n=1 Tax=Zalaria obscura TaxID=2024903 RepID=A0ACC3SD14_9PEZI